VCGHEGHARAVDHSRASRGEDRHHRVSDEITTFAEKALQPAKVSRVSIADLTEKQLEVIVDDTQLSLAIGKKGRM